MTQEEKARAYDEALNWMRTIYPSLSGADKEDAEHFFPDLRESEDERIRKDIVAAVEMRGDLTQARKSEIYAYLEKQKESLRDFIDDFPYSDQKEQKPAESISQLTFEGKGVYKICPRCKERMIRDDSKVYTSMPPQYSYECPKCGAMEFDTVIYDNPEMEEQKEECSENERIRKALINYFKSYDTLVGENWNGIECDDVIAYLEKQKEPENISASTMIPSCWNTDSIEEEVERYFYYEFEDGMTNEDIAYHFANWQRQKDLEENSKSSDSIPPDCVSNAKGEDRWHKVEDSLPDNTREVLCKDAIGNYFIGRYYSKGIWEISIYDDCDKSNEDNPPVVMWIDIPYARWKPSEEQMGALSWMLENARGNIDFDPLKELYEQLKKL